LNDILERLEASLGPLSGEPVALHGGITNRNYRATLGGKDYVIRMPGKDTELLGIDREAERVANGTAAMYGLAPAVAGWMEDCLVTEFVACKTVEQEDVARSVEEIARALHTFHESGVRLSAHFWVPDLLAHYAEVAERRGALLDPSYKAAQLVAERIEVALPLTEPQPCHNDLLSANLIRAQGDGRLMIVDWEYAGMGHPLFDLGNLAVNNELGEQAEERLLVAYYEATPTDVQRATLKVMRVLSDAREGAWAVVQARLSQLDFDFAGYADKHFERLQSTTARLEFDEWLSHIEHTTRKDPHHGKTA
jgi:thiamine kinase-like enzyme